MQKSPGLSFRCAQIGQRLQAKFMGSLLDLFPERTSIVNPFRVELDKMMGVSERSSGMSVPCRLLLEGKSRRMFGAEKAEFCLCRLLTPLYTHIKQCQTQT